MEYISKVNSDVMKCHGIVIGKNKPFVAIVLIVVSCVLFAYSLMLDDIVNMSSALLFFALAIGIAGLVMLFFRNVSIIDSVTGKVLYKRVYFFENSEEEMVKNIVEKGDFDILCKSSNNKSTLPLMLVIYVTRLGNCAMYQFFRYVPHSYQPITDMQYYRNDEVKTETDGFIYNTVDSRPNIANCGC